MTIIEALKILLDLAIDNALVKDNIHPEDSGLISEAERQELAIYIVQDHLNNQTALMKRAQDAEARFEALSTAIMKLADVTDDDV
jgi:hypothetical protein